MTIDISRKSFNHRKNYSGLISEQGRVQLDADWNEAAAIADRRLRVETLDIFGRRRVSRETRDAFRIGIDAGSLTIGLGRMYVDGLLAENHGDPTEHFDPVLAELTGTAVLPLEQQPSLIAINPDVQSDGIHLVYLDVWYRDVTHIEDPELIEKAVGIPTASRTQAVWQVKILNEALGTSIGCSVPDEAIPSWHDLIQPSDGRLSTRDVVIPNTDDPCLLPPSGGYRGLENRTYRVEIHSVDGDGNATFKWSRYNATISSAVNAIPSLNRLEVESTHKDPIMRFNDGNWVEILDDALEFSGQSGIVRRIEPVGDATNTITLTSPLPLGIFPPVGNDSNLDPARHTRVRRWDQSGEVRDTNNNLIVDLDAPDSDGVIPVPAAGTSIVLEDGVQITFEEFSRPEGRYRAGDFWVFTTRTVDAFVEVLDHEPPCGIHHHYCRLALVEVVNNEFTAIVEDCRVFTPDEFGSARGCCSVTVAPHESIQNAIDTLPEQGGRLCLLPGIYVENFIIDGRRDITLVGCGKRTRIISEAPDAQGGWAEPVITIRNSMQIHIESLAVGAHSTGVGILVGNNVGAPNENVSFQNTNLFLGCLYINAAQRSGIEIRAGRNITIRDCQVSMDDVRTEWPGIFLIAQDVLIQDNEIRVLPSNRTESIRNGRGGIQLGGTCEEIRVINNLIQGGINPGIAFGSLVVRRDNENSDDMVWLPPRNSEPCDECEPISPWIPIADIRAVSFGENATAAVATRNFLSSGSLYNIDITGNRIIDMGLYGIGVIGFFEPGNDNQSPITVNRLTICNNIIQGCLSRPLELIDASMANNMGYGAITLSDVEDLVICHNKIESNGQNSSAPICGVYIFYAEGVDISDNQILNNGIRLNTREVPQLGPRGGIYIAHATVSTTEFPAITQGSSVGRARLVGINYQAGKVAAKIHDNIVIQPVGYALYIQALGAVLVAKNQLVSRGLVLPPPNRDAVAFSLSGFVRILNFGVSPAMLGRLHSFTSISKESAGRFLGFLGETPNELNNSFQINGNILFSDNQCFMDTSLILFQRFPMVPIVIAGFGDDVACHGNQFVFSAPYNIFAHAIILGMAMRLSDNGFTENIIGDTKSISVITHGVMNTTVNNQATHEFNISSPLASGVVDSGNTVLSAIIVSEIYIKLI